MRPVHDSQKLDDLLDLCNTGKEVWARIASSKMLPKILRR
jgi:hypothetical protein